MECENSDRKSETRVRVSNVGLIEYANTNRKEGYFNDVTIEVGEKSIAANRMVLSCCCPYFEKMFKSNFKESQSAKVEMQKIDGRAVSSLIEFIYTGVITIDNDNVMELLAAADYLQLDEVRQFCHEFVESTINNDTCCAILSDANLYGQETLREKALSFIISNFENAKSKEILLSKPDLILCVTKLNREQTNESKIYQILIDLTKYDPPNRKNDFPQLFQLLKLKNITPEFLDEKISNEKLVTENFTCSNFLMKAL